MDSDQNRSHLLNTNDEASEASLEASLNYQTSCCKACFLLSDWGSITLFLGLYQFASGTYYRFQDNYNFLERTMWENAAMLLGTMH